MGHKCVGSAPLALSRGDLPPCKNTNFMLRSMVLHSPPNTCSTCRGRELTGHKSTSTVHVVDRPGKGYKLGRTERYPGTKEDVGRRAIWAVQACKLIHSFIHIFLVLITLLLCVFAARLKANTVMSREMARRYGDRGIVSMSLNPGTSVPRTPTPVSAC